MAQPTNLTEWLMLAIFTAAIVVIWYIVRHYFEGSKLDQKENTEATKELTKSNIQLSERLTSFQVSCDKMEDITNTRLDRHRDEIAGLKQVTVRIDTQVKNHATRLNIVEKKINK
jgi:hypothetical protein